MRASSKILVAGTDVVVIRVRLVARLGIGEIPLWHLVR